MDDLSVSRNLLFGILALQNHLIDQADLVGAFHAWSADKRTSLAGVLRARGAMDAANVALVDALVTLHLKKHGGDPRKSLAAVADADARDAIRSVDDAEVRRSLSSLPPAAGHVLVETLVRPTETRSRYTLTRLHAEGGLGKVWVARDADINREVALKEIRPQQAEHPDAWRRFLKEAQITGQLEHPGIVPVYELSRRGEDDQPFYTMRFVRGRTLRAAIAEAHGRWAGGPADPLELQTLLSAFVGVCQAIGYAHSRGVIHRDLKPENVVLGGFGEVIVLDWGLAKMVDRPDEEGGAEHHGPDITVSEEADAVQTHGVVGTPAYMAPEQVEARHDLIDARTDIYGLGGILYEVLTGRPPAGGASTAEVYQAILSGAIPRVRERSAGVPRALEAVCHKALARDRWRRYAKATDLAEDVRRWMADEPVSAWPEPFHVRARRWVARHRTLVTAAAAAAAVAVAGLAASTALLTAANAEVQRQRDAARTQRDQAASNYRLARDAVDRYFTQVNENPRLRAVDSEGLRKDLLRSAATFYEEFVRRRSDDPAVRLEQGRAYDRLARLTLEVGSKPEALDLYRKAIDIKRSLSARAPDDPEIRVELATSRRGLGAAQMMTGAVADAEASFREVIAALERVAAARPADEAVRGDLAGSYGNLSMLYRSTGRPEKAEEALRAALALREALVRDHPGSAPHQTELAKMWTGLGLHFHDQGKLDQAEPYYRKAVALREALVRDHPDVADYRNLLAEARTNLAIVCNDTGRYPEAEAAFKGEIDDRQALARAHPSVTTYQIGLAWALSHLGSFYEERGRMDEAESWEHKAVDYAERIAREHPELTEVVSRLGGQYGNIGNLFSHTGRDEEALGWFARSAATLQGLLDRGTQDTEAREFLRNTYAGRGESLTRLGRHAEAIADWDRAIALDTGLRASSYRLYRAMNRAHTGDHARAVAEAEPLSGSEPFQAAYVFSMASAAARRDASLPASERSARADRYARRAVALLAAARSENAPDVARRAAGLQTDKELDPLRSRDDFRRLLMDWSFPADPFAPPAL